MLWNVIVEHQILSCNQSKIPFDKNKINKKHQLHILFENLLIKMSW